MAAVRSAALITTLILVPMGASRSWTGEQSALCTPIPPLYGQWRDSVVGPGRSDADLEAFVRRAWSHVAGLPDPFGPLATADSNTLAASQERRVSKGDSAFVLVAREPLPKLLVIPTRDIWFITEASPELQKELARLAAAASDALQLAAGRTCGPQAATLIYIHRPNELGVRRLHIHVQPRQPIRISDPDSFYTDVARRLRLLALP